MINKRAAPMPIEFRDWVDNAANEGRFEYWLRDPFEANAYLTRFNLEIADVIRRLGEEAADKAIWHLYCTAGGTVWDATEPSLASARTTFMDSVKVLYTEGFAKFCSPHLGHLDSGNHTARPLNSACYMLWDMDGIECRAIQGDGEMVKLSLEVLRHALAIPHPACQESALHGMSHLYSFRGCRDEVRSIIQHEFLQRHRILPELIEYAKQAAHGLVE
jgi:hypothetical protein